MEYEAWAPIYEAIVTAFGFDPAADRRARDYLDHRVARFDRSRIDVTDQTVAIAGGSESLVDELDSVRAAESVVAVSSAATVLFDDGIEPDLIVTDLDGTPQTAIELSHEGVPVAVHGHGDNRDALEEYLPQFDHEQVLATTQVEPTKRVLNLGGFTDGDRAASIVDELGASGLSFPGWNFDDPGVSIVKARKLRWAGLLLRCLERRRDEHFDLLDGRREDLEATIAAAPWASSCRSGT